MCSIIIVTSGLLKGYVQGVEDSKHILYVVLSIPLVFCACTGAS